MAVCSHAKAQRLVEHGVERQEEVKTAQASSGSDVVHCLQIDGVVRDCIEHCVEEGRSCRLLDSVVSQSCIDFVFEPFELDGMLKERFENRQEEENSKTN